MTEPLKTVTGEYYVGLDPNELEGMPLSHILELAQSRGYQSYTNALANLRKDQYIVQVDVKVQVLFEKHERLAFMVRTPAERKLVPGVLLYKIDKVGEMEWFVYTSDSKELLGSLVGSDKQT